MSGQGVVPSRSSWSLSCFFLARSLASHPKKNINDVSDHKKKNPLSRLTIKNLRTPHFDPPLDDHWLIILGNPIYW